MIFRVLTAEGNIKVLKCRNKMLTLDSSKIDLKKYLDSFIWTYKIGDNILYNLDTIFHLVDDHNSSKGRNYTKPISVLCVSVIEAVLVDFLERLDVATYHFPKKLNSKKIDIKEQLHKEKNEYEITYEEQVIKLKRLRNFGYKELIDFYEKFDLLELDTKHYQILQSLGRFRNRVHIRNYFGNFERNESRAFSEARTQIAIKYMTAIFKHLFKNYQRP